MSIMLINLFLFLGNWTAFKSVTLATALRTSHLCDYSTAAQHLTLLLH